MSNGVRLWQSRRPAIRASKVPWRSAVALLSRLEASNAAVAAANRDLPAGAGHVLNAEALARGVDANACGRERRDRPWRRRKAARV